MIEDKDKKPYPYLKEATPEMVGELAKKFEEMRQMTGSDGRYDKPKPKPKKKVMEPIEIPEVLSVHRTQPIKKTEVIESNTRPQIPVGLSQRFTQDKIREAQILKELDREMAIDERKNNQITNEEGDKWLVNTTTVQ